MHRALSKRGLFAAITIVVLGMVLGCSGADLLDDPGGGNYSAVLRVDFQDSDTVETLQVDTARTICSIEYDSSTGIYTYTYDWYSDTMGHVDISVAETAAGMTLESYSVEYIPMLDSDAVGGPYTAPALVNPLPKTTSVYIGPGETYAVPIQLVSMSTHNEFNQKMGWLDSSFNWVGPDYDEPQEGTYIIRVTLQFANNDVELVLDRTTYWSEYTYCD